MLKIPPAFAKAKTRSPQTAKVRSRPVPGPPFLARTGVMIALAVTLGVAPSSVEAVDSGIYGGGVFYAHNTAANIVEIKNAGFTEVIVWNIAVNTSGDLNFNYEFLLCSNGSYVGNSVHPDFPGNMASLKQAGITRITFSIGSSNVGVFQAIKGLVNAQGTGPGSILYKNFQALKAAVPSVDAIDFDDENCYDQSSMVKFAVMLGNLGYKVSLCPYTNSNFWKSVASQANSQLPGVIDRVHLQCYAGGGGNSPNSTWNFGSVPVEPGLWDSDDTPSAVGSKIGAWKNQYQIIGGWMWLYDDFAGSGKAAQYASAINNAIGYVAPAINSASAATATVGVPFSYQITAANSPTTYNATGLPSGLIVNTRNGAISGTPSKAGNFNTTITATNPAGFSKASLAITVQATFAAWQNGYFTAAELNNPAVSGPNATPAGDGISNLVKYALGLDPKSNGAGALPATRAHPPTSASVSTISTHATGNTNMNWYMSVKQTAQ